MKVGMAFCPNHGIGDELSLAGPLFTSLLSRENQICVWTHHPNLYNHPKISVSSWASLPSVGFVPPRVDLGLCVYSRRPPSGWIPGDKTPVVMPACQDQGWRMLDGDGQSNGIKFDASHEYSAWLLSDLGLPRVGPPWAFLPRQPLDYILLNPFGWGDVRKGLDFTGGWQAVIAVAQLLPKLAFRVVLLRELSVSIPEDLPRNLAVHVYEYGDRAITALYLAARLVVTAEGGGITWHMGPGWMCY